MDAFCTCPSRVSANELLVGKVILLAVMTSTRRRLGSDQTGRHKQKRQEKKSPTRSTERVVGNGPQDRENGDHNSNGQSYETEDGTKNLALAGFPQGLFRKASAYTIQLKLDKYPSGMSHCHLPRAAR